MVEAQTLKASVRLSPEWEAKLDKLYDLGVRRLKRARKTFFRKSDIIVTAWDARLYQIIENERRKVSGKNSLWDRKLRNLVAGWNIWYYQLLGHPPVLVKTIYRKHSDWQSRFSYMLRRYYQEHKQYGWDRKFDTLRKCWADTGKQIKGGIGFMDKTMPNERIGIIELRQMLVKQDLRCALSGRDLTASNCSLDHIVPLSRGGVHTKENAQLVCDEVNRAKGMMTESEFIELCQDVIKWKK
ncbi:MAG: HNH endonuclease [Candidatus Omnitrophota bacterium]